MGVALVCEFLRNVGIDTIKPDRHICRIASNKYLNLLSDDLSNQISRKKELNDNDKIRILIELEKYAKSSNVKPHILDAFLWDFCASGSDNARICMKRTPRCNKCVFQDVCNMQLK